MDNLASDDIQSEIAFIGMSERFPKAKTLDQFRLILREGRSSLVWSAADPKAMTDIL